MPKKYPLISSRHLLKWSMQPEPFVIVYFLLDRKRNISSVCPCLDQNYRLSALEDFLKYLVLFKGIG